MSDIIRKYVNEEADLEDVLEVGPFDGRGRPRDVGDFPPELRDPIERLRELHGRDFIDSPNIRVTKDEISSETFKDWLKRSDDIPDGIFQGVPSFDVEYRLADTAIDPEPHAGSETGGFAYDIWLVADDTRVAQVTSFLEGVKFGDVWEFEGSASLKDFEFLLKK